MSLRKENRAIGIGIMLVLTTFASLSANVRAENLSPHAEAGGPYIGYECHDMEFNATGSYDPESAPLTYQWYIKGAWVPIEPTADIKYDYLWQNDFSGEVILRVSDGDLTATDNASVTVLNVPPVITDVTGPTEIALGTEASFSVNFYDGFLDPRGLIASLDNHTAIFDFGDGTVMEYQLAPQIFSVDSSNMYSVPGIYHIIITIFDDHGGNDTAVWNLTVVGNLPSVEAGPDGSIFEGSTFVSVGFFTKTEEGTYTAMVDYGDGSGSQPLSMNATYMFNLSHQYVENGLYTIVVTIWKDGTAYVSDSALITVMNVAPTAILTNDGPKDEGSPVTFSFTNQYDPGSSDTFSYSFDWNNDGTYDIIDQVGASASYIWYDNGVYTVKGMIKDDDGDYNAYTTDVMVNNVPPTATLGNDGPKGEGSPVAVSFTNHFDPGSSDTFSYSFDWNNDGTYEIVGQASASATHIWYDDGSYIVKGKIQDDDGGFSEYTTIVIVNNVAPTATLTNDGPKNEGSPVVVSFAGQYDPGTSDTFTYSFDWNNDGTFEIVDQASPSAVYIWYDNGIYTVKGKIKDNYGGFTEYTTAVSVLNVPPIITLLSGPVDPVLLGVQINMIGEFTDPGILDTHTALIEWGDGLTTTVNLATGVYQVSRSHTYANVGVYTITLTVTDDDGGSDTKTIESYIVIYSPNCGFITGGGHIISPQGSYPANPTLSGKVTFGLVSKYKKGQTIPEGNTEVQIHFADMNFHSYVYEWLIIVGAKATYLGEGTINGQGHYGFRLTAIDGKISGGGGVDKFRIKIWDKDNDDQIVYDTDYGAPDGQNPSVALSDGQITIHKA